MSERERAGRYAVRETGGQAGRQAGRQEATSLPPPPRHCRANQNRMMWHKRKSVFATCTMCTAGRGNEAEREGGGETNETIACTKKKQRQVRGRGKGGGG